MAVASLGGLWPAVPANHIPTPTTPAWTHSNPPVWCQTPAHTHLHTHTHTGNNSSCKHCSQLHFQTWITTELTLCDPLPKQKDAPLYIQTHTCKHIYANRHTHQQTHTNTHARTHTRGCLGGVNCVWILNASSPYVPYVSFAVLLSIYLLCCCKDKSKLLSHAGVVSIKAIY